MPNREFFGRIQQIFRAPGACEQGIKAGLKAQRLKMPAAPMTDHELARAIREFQSGSDRIRRQLGEGSEGN
jgi:hypothetical protein